MNQRKLIRVIIAVFLFNFFLSVPVVFAADTNTIQYLKGQLSDTAFIDRLKQYEPGDTEVQIRRRYLLDSPYVDPREKLEIYRRWTAESDRLPQPEKQIRTALQSDEDTLAQKWLSSWLETRSRNRRLYTSIADELVSAGKLDWARRTLRQGQKQSGNSIQFFRRLGAIEQALGNPTQALAYYLRAWYRFQRSSFLKIQVESLVRNYGLERELIEKLTEVSSRWKKIKYVMNTVETFLIEEQQYDLFVEWAERRYQKPEAYREHLRELRDRLIEQNKLIGARFIAEKLLDNTDNASDIFSIVKIDLRSNQIDSAVRRLEKIDTRLQNDPQYQKLVFERYLRDREFKKVQELINQSSVHDWPRDLLVGYYRGTGQYQQWLKMIPKENFVMRWLVKFRTADSNDTLLKKAVETQSSDPRLPVVFALSGMEDAQLAREFLRKMDQYPLNIPVDTKPIETLMKMNSSPPNVLVDRWFERYDPISVAVELLEELGTSLGYPPLLIDVARRYRELNRHGEGIRILENLLINHPFMMERAEAETLLNELS